MQVTVKCPACTTDSSFFIAKNIFQGPFKCWKCKALFTLKVKDSEIKTLRALAQEVFDKAKADAEARRKKKKKRLSQSVCNLRSYQAPACYLGWSFCCFEKPFIITI